MTKTEMPAEWFQNDLLSLRTRIWSASVKNCCTDTDRGAPPLFKPLLKKAGGPKAMEEYLLTLVGDRNWRMHSTVEMALRRTFGNAVGLRQRHDIDRLEARYVSETKNAIHELTPGMQKFTRFIDEYDAYLRNGVEVKVSGITFASGRVAVSCLGGDPTRKAEGGAYDAAGWVNWNDLAPRGYKPNHAQLMHATECMHKEAHRRAIFNLLVSHVSDFEEPVEALGFEAVRNAIENTPVTGTGAERVKAIEHFGRWRRNWRVTSAQARAFEGLTGDVRVQMQAIALGSLSREGSDQAGLTILPGEIVKAKLPEGEVGCVVLHVDHEQYQAAVSTNGVLDDLVWRPSESVWLGIGELRPSGERKSVWEQPHALA